MKIIFTFLLSFFTIISFCQEFSELQSLTKSNSDFESFSTKITPISENSFLTHTKKNIITIYTDGNKTFTAKVSDMKAEYQKHHVTQDKIIVSNATKKGNKTIREISTYDLSLKKLNTKTFEFASKTSYISTLFFDEFNKILIYNFYNQDKGKTLRYKIFDYDLNTLVEHELKIPFEFSLVEIPEMAMDENGNIFLMVRKHEKFEKNYLGTYCLKISKDEVKKIELNLDGYIVYDFSFIINKRKTTLIGTVKDDNKNNSVEGLAYVDLDFEEEKVKNYEVHIIDELNYKFKSLNYTESTIKRIREREVLKNNYSTGDDYTFSPSHSQNGNIFITMQETRKIKTDYVSVSYGDYFNFSFSSEGELNWSNSIEKFTAYQRKMVLSPFLVGNNLVFTGISKENMYSSGGQPLEKERELKNNMYVHVFYTIDLVDGEFTEKPYLKPFNNGINVINGKVVFLAKESKTSDKNIGIATAIFD